MTEDKEVTTVSITRGAINLLSTTLAMQSWYSDTKTAFIAGRLLVDKIGELPGIRTKRPVADDEADHGEEMRRYLMERFDLTLSDEEREVCEKCLQFFISKGALNINAYLVELMDFLGMKPE
jgi:hypothetical protein